MQRRNFQKELDQIILENQRNQKVPTLLLHSCCAPCSSYCLEYLSRYFQITVFYFNPNITDPDEYRRRVLEQKRLLARMPVQRPVAFMEGAYEPRRFYEMARGMENLPEGGPRCKKCFQMRLSQAADTGEKNGFDYVTTTLSISPLKNAGVLNAIGEEETAGKQICWLPSDFKKKDGYRRSVALSREYGLYRQDYCGCQYSREERERARKDRLSEKNCGDGGCTGQKSVVN